MPRRLQFNYLIRTAMEACKHNSLVSFPTIVSLFEITQLEITCRWLKLYSLSAFFAISQKNHLKIKI